MEARTSLLVNAMCPTTDFEIKLSLGPLLGRINKDICLTPQRQAPMRLFTVAHFLRIWNAHSSHRDSLAEPPKRAIEDCELVNLLRAVEP